MVSQKWLCLCAPIFLTYFWRSRFAICLLTYWQSQSSSHHLFKEGVIVAMQIPRSFHGFDFLFICPHFLSIIFCLDLVCFPRKLFQYSFRAIWEVGIDWFFLNHSQIMDIMGGNFSKNSQISIIIYPNEQEVFQEEECLGTIHILRHHF